MAREIRTFAVTIPAGTTRAAPFTADTSFPDRVVTRVTWRVPPGPAGVMGWRLTMGGVQVMPLPAGAWIVTDGAGGEWVLDGQPDSGAWQVTGYNTGQFPHTVYLDFHVDLVQLAPAGPPARYAPAPAVQFLTGTVTP